MNHWISESLSPNREPIVRNMWRMLISTRLTSQQLVSDRWYFYKWMRRDNHICKNSNFIRHVSDYHFLWLFSCGVFVYALFADFDVFLSSWLYFPSNITKTTLYSNLSLTFQPKSLSDSLCISALDKNLRQTLNIVVHRCDLYGKPGGKVNLICLFGLLVVVPWINGWTSQDWCPHRPILVKKPHCCFWFIHIHCCDP